VRSGRFPSVLWWSIHPNNFRLPLSLSFLPQKLSKQHPRHAASAIRRHLTKEKYACRCLHGDACALSHNGTREDTQRQALMQSAKDSVQHVNVTQRLIQGPYSLLLCCHRGLHRFGFLYGTYGQPDDSQYVLLATLSCCWQQLMMVFLGACCLHNSNDTKIVRRVQVHFTGGLANSGTFIIGVKGSYQRLEHNLNRNAQDASAGVVGLLACLGDKALRLVSPGSALSCSVMDIISEER
jgi:hypothetical protein